MIESSAPPVQLRLLVRAVTPLVKAVLRSPAHRCLSGTMMILTVTGRRTGRSYQIPISYVADGAVVTCITGIENTWWKNLRGGAEVTVLLQRKRFGGHAEASTGVANIPVIESFLSARPRDARFHHVRRSGPGQFDADDLARAAQTRVVIRVQLWPEG
ncbi:nitroreductase/quinone reductase family protein [Mycolicibacterium fortuitum]|uniref:nitroreductase/quinone reductase family protein n=1 Tax=Mycolicibacterium fortuitum TaxID=1766 RepID=UPI001AEF9F52|nr:nitroreductase/quinone reductase family protein [Mycolicibacterium fortuitum]MBP3083573.1 nitroreductase family deazaflavin-dependent oxidoreductase [Mycolicibacterium fortuitum]